MGGNRGERRRSLGALGLPVGGTLGAVPLALGLGGESHTLEVEPLDRTLRRGGGVRG